ncbi:MAG: ammonia-forming cytochrome c nitrite reductase subunit c552 [Candidatus Eisenbacteria bacterium]
MAGRRGGRSRARDPTPGPAADEHLRAQGGILEPLLPRRRDRRQHRGPGDLGQELPPAVRSLQQHGRHGAHALRRREALPRQPVELDPRETVSTSRLVEDPRLREFWAGYAFATDYREERGHAFMLLDQLYTERQRVVQQPGACLHCHASVYTVYRDAGGGDLMAGFAKVNQLPFQEAAALAEFPVACIDCHNPENMQLRITRPALIEGLRALTGDPAYDVNAEATRHEMRAFVCAQCHVEYYFRGTEKHLTYPWSKGLRADEVLAYYEEAQFKDWTHGISGAPVLKAQHPEFELYTQGIHARSGVTCADCHMPYMRTGALKISDHWVRSPVLNIDNACQTCHRWSEAELRDRVFTIQDRTYQLRNIAIDAVLELTKSIPRAAASGIAEQRLAAARTYQRRAQFLTDFIEAENSMGFHADQEAARILGLAINYARLGSAALYAEELPSAAPLLLPAPPQTTVPPGPARARIFEPRAAPEGRPPVGQSS